MKAIRVICAGVLAILVSCGAARAQQPESNGKAPAPASIASVQEGQPSGHTLSNWITYNRDNCCEAVGGGIPVGTEFFFRAGPTIPLGGTIFGDVLGTGWMIDGGVRALWFDAPMDRAWTFSASISNSNNSANDEADRVQVPLSKFLPTTLGVVQRFTVLPTLRKWNRTFVNAGIGREWYYRPASSRDGTNWRWGVDGGLRYGTSKVDFSPFGPPAPSGIFVSNARTITHGTDVIGGTWAALHGDLEIPWGCCILVYGLRGEWSYTWSDILQQTSDLQELNFLVNFGVRY